MTATSWTAIGRASADFRARGRDGRLWRTLRNRILEGAYLKDDDPRRQTRHSSTHGASEQ